MAQRLLTRAAIGIASVCGLLVAATVTSSTAPAAAVPLPCLTVARTDLADEGSVFREELTTYRVTTSHSYWSVVATRGSQGYDSDLVLHDRAGCVLASSTQGGFTPTDWVAFDNNAGRLPIGSYRARVDGHAGNTNPVRYMVQFVKGRQSLPTSTVSFQPIGADYAAWMVDVRDVYLSAGTTYTFTVTGGLSAMYLLGSTADAAGWAKTAATADYSLRLPGTDLDTAQTGRLTVTPPRSGWYGALFVRNGWWGAPVSVQISAS